MQTSSASDAPFFSIVTPSYNQGEFIRQTIESVLAQKRDAPELEIEYLVRDNLSTDATANILNLYQDHIRVFREKDAGQADAINKGWKETRGQWLAWLNADDLYEPGALATAHAAAAANPNARWIVGNFRIVNRAGDPIGKLHSAYKNFLLQRYSYNLLLSENIIPQMSVFIRRDLAEQAGALPASDPLAFDYEYWLRLGRICDPLVLNQRLSVFRYHSDSKTALGHKEQFRRELEYARRYATGPRWPVWLHTFNYYKTILLYDFVKKF